MTETQTLTTKQQARLDRILQSAESLMLSRGFYKLSLSDLTAELRVSRSTLYEHFGSKEGLVEVISDRYRQKLGAGLEDIFNAPTLSPAEKLRAMALQTAQNLDGKNTRWFMKDLEVHLPDQYAAYLSDRSERVTRYYAPLINAAISQGQLTTALPEKYLLHLYLNMVRMACESGLIEQSGMTKTEVIKHTVAVFFAGASKP